MRMQQAQRVASARLKVRVDGVVPVQLSSMTHSTGKYNGASRGGKYLSNAFEELMAYVPHIGSRLGLLESGWGPLRRVYGSLQLRTRPQRQREGWTFRHHCFR